MPEFVRRHNDPREASSVLHYGHTVDLLQSLVHHTGPAHVGKPRGASVAVTVAGLSSENISVRKKNISWRFRWDERVARSLLLDGFKDEEGQGTDSSEDILHNEYMTQQTVLL